MKQYCPRSGPFSQPTLRGNRPTCAISPLIKNGYGKELSNAMVHVIRQ